MRYMLLIHTEESCSPSADERSACNEAHSAFLAECVERGVYVDSSPLQASHTATTVRVDALGRRLTVDGPFAETREQLGGYYVLDCRDLDEALEFAGRCPIVTGAGSIEVRPLIDVRAERSDDRVTA